MVLRTWNCAQHQHRAVDDPRRVALRRCEIGHQIIGIKRGHSHECTGSVRVRPGGPHRINRFRPSVHNRWWVGARWTFVHTQMVCWKIPLVSVFSFLSCSTQFLKGCRNVVLFWLPPQDVVAKMLSVGLSVQLEADSEPSLEESSLGWRA